MSLLGLSNCDLTTMNFSFTAVLMQQYNNDNSISSNKSLSLGTKLLRLMLIGMKWEIMLNKIQILYGFGMHEHEHDVLRSHIPGLYVSQLEHCAYVWILIEFKPSRSFGTENAINLCIQCKLNHKFIKSLIIRESSHFIEYNVQCSLFLR